MPSEVDIIPMPQMGSRRVRVATLEDLVLLLFDMRISRADITIVCPTPPHNMSNCIIVNTHRKIPQYKIDIMNQWLTLACRPTFINVAPHTFLRKWKKWIYNVTTVQPDNVNVKTVIDMGYH